MANRFIALCAPGVERVVAREIRALGGGIGKTKPVTAQVVFEGPDDAVLRANLHLRSADRILLILSEFEALDFDALKAQLFTQPWQRFVGPDAAVAFNVRASRCKLFHTGAVEEAAGHALSSWGATLAGPETSKKQIIDIDLRGDKDLWTIAVDTSGARLGRRGKRRDVGPAPLRADLAGACLTALDWDGRTPLLDPMCGSGSLLLEAASMAGGQPAGMNRSFAAQRFPTFDAERWQELLAAVPRPPRDLAVEGADKDGMAVRRTREALQKSGLAGRVRLHKRSIVDTPPAKGAGLVIFNPPWGKRLQVADAATWAKWGQALRAARPGWTLAVLSPEEKLARAFGATGRPLLRFRHGGITVALHALRPR